MPDTLFCIMAMSGTCIQQPGADIGQAIRRARRVLPKGEKIVGAIQVNCIVTPEPDAVPFRVMVVRNQVQPAPAAPAGETGGKSDA